MWNAGEQLTRHETGGSKKREAPSDPGPYLSDGTDLVFGKHRGQEMAVLEGKVAIVTGPQRGCLPRKGRR